MHASDHRQPLTTAFNAAPTSVGSFPHTEAEPLIEKIFSMLKEMPAWPQLPARQWRESMYVQYAEGLPAAEIDYSTQHIHFQTDHRLHEELEAFYQAVIEENVEYFSISPANAMGLYSFLQSAQRLRPRWVKGQVTGPFSFSMSVTDENKRLMAYTPELLEVANQGMAMKARWMARKLKEVAEEALVVLDEPYLCSFGSAFVNVAREEVIVAIDQAVEAIHKEGALAGLHCCGNTDWSLVMSTAVDVVNFDAHDYFQGLSCYPDDLKTFLSRGGTLSYGIVPTTRSLEGVGAKDLKQKLSGYIDILVSKGIDRQTLYHQSLLTPSCGMGTQSIQEAERVVELLVELSSMIRDEGGF